MKNWDLNFAPSYAPKQMLEEGVFEGKYINAIKGLPASWYKLPKVLGPKDESDEKIDKRVSRHHRTALVNLVN